MEQTEEIKKEKILIEDMSNDEMKKRLYYLKKQILTLEWDISKNQLNSGKANFYKRIKDEYLKLQHLMSKTDDGKKELNEELKELNN